MTINVASGGVGLLSFILTGYTNTVTFNNTLTVAGTVTLAGTMAGTGTLLCIETATLTSNAVALTGTLQLKTSGKTFTLADNWTVGNIGIPSTSSITVNGNIIYNNGNFTLTGNGNIWAGTTKVVMQGTGSISNSSISGTSDIRCDLDINTSGTITISSAASSLKYSGGTLTYIAGTVVTTSSTLTIADNTTLNTAGIIWNNISCTATGKTYTLNSLLTCTGTLTCTQTQTFSGISGFTCTNFTTTGAGGTITLKEGLLYTITGAITSTNGTSASKITFTSSHASNMTYLILKNGATQDNGFLNGTRIDSSGGKQICTYKGILTTTTNWRGLPTQTNTISY